ncbi:hypothetical protein A3D71_02555 [Candidatus Kaiserbacteria bacterium RIFCSPHIGHO2_02_FULL_55_20]|uniref:methionyl-tRNA formyltransferase n=1 Tax=Candidatus Kaiserbacteria bacterium RIFCSPHIGHO2_02_FULL_55_20 TaxID=1798497 RepID=A0A1F6DYK7_9BACT|nr:MAG: hypothetical protein A2680_00880 [Candidatus Kaiserbacteria bacterium RIFCSPHIGHO2_01_FULL_55_37]OGG66427.1 MAG: hypothetical protein A3D71_02555 [Candidatus Kaiserbacteria bacterium RIFCSPHIGHO2_02_FULL_55_20]
MTKNLKNMSDVRFVFFGTPARACDFLNVLETNGLVPSLVVTTPDTVRGRGMEVSAPPVKDWAQTRGISVIQPEEFGEKEAEALRAAAADVFVVIYYGKVLPREVLDIPKHGVLNIHFSLLPRWRGTSPVRAAIANNDKEVGTSIMLLDEKIDHGPLIAQKRIALPQCPPKASELEDRATEVSANLLIEILPSWLAGDIEARPQNHDVATTCPKYTKEDGRLDLSADAYENLTKIQAFDTTVGTHAFFERSGKKIRVGIIDAHIEGTKLILDTVKPEGKKEMAYEEFLRSGARPT